MQDEKQTAGKQRLIDLTIPCRAGDRKVSLRFPSDEEWIKRQNARRIIEQSLGRGQTRMDVLGDKESDEALAKAILPEDFALQPGEATLIANVLSTALVTDVVRDGQQFLVTLQTVGGEQTTYALHVPSLDQVMDYKREFSRPIGLPFGKTQYKMSLKAGADLFDALCDQKTISVIYKSEIVRAIASELERMMEPSTEGL